MRAVKRVRGLALAGLFAVALAGGGGGARAEAGLYEPAGGGFAVAFPGRPEKRWRSQNYGPLVLTATAYGLEREGMSYFVSWFGDLPAADARDPLLEEIFYTRMEQEIVMKARAEDGGEVSVAARTAVSLGGFDGRQCVFDSDSLMGVLRAYRAGQRFYTVGVFGAKPGFSPRRAVAFLDSFRLTVKK